jgi:DNA-binding XRE family transcriptional regulator
MKPMKTTGDISVSITAVFETRLIACQEGSLEANSSSLALLFNCLCYNLPSMPIERPNITKQPGLQEKSAQNNPHQDVLDMMNRQTRLQILRSTGMSPDVYERERREVDALIEALYINETRPVPGTIIFAQYSDTTAQNRRSFPSPFILRELSAEEYRLFHSTAQTHQDVGIGRTIQRATSEYQFGAEEDDTNHFGKNLRDARNRAGLKQKELAERTSTDHTYISKIERGAFLPSRNLALGLADGLGISNKADRLVFLLSANVGSLEDIKGFRLVPEPPPSTSEEPPR